jgi:ankyrin repeat protein
VQACSEGNIDLVRTLLDRSV